jgi:hypothetical protein
VNEGGVFGGTRLACGLFPRALWTLTAADKVKIPWDLRRGAGLGPDHALDEQRRDPMVELAVTLVMEHSGEAARHAVILSRLMPINGLVLSTTWLGEASRIRRRASQQAVANANR